MSIGRVKQWARGPKWGNWGESLERGVALLAPDKRGELNGKETIRARGGGKCVSSIIWIVLSKVN